MSTVHFPAEFSEIKDPNDVLYYTLDFAPSLADGETITTFTLADDDGLTVDNLTRNGAVAQFRVSGGVLSAGKLLTAYLIKLRATLNSGAILERSVRLNVGRR